MKLKYILPAGFICLMVSQAVIGQNNAVVNKHTITVGISTRLISDAFISLSSQKISTAELGYTFSSSNTYRKKSISLNWCHGILKVDKEEIKLNDFTFQYTDAFSLIKNKNKRLNIYVGYSITLNPQYIKRDNGYSWTTINALSLYNSVVYSWKGNAISFDLNIPVAGFASRPQANSTYTGNAIEMIYNSYGDPVFTSVHNLKAIITSLQYQKRLGERLFFKAGTYFFYKDLQTGYNFLEQGYGFNSGLSYRFR